VPRIKIPSFLKRSSNASQEGHKLTFRHVLNTATQRRFPSFAQWKHVFRILSPKETFLVRLGAAISVLGLIGLGLGYGFSHRTQVAAVGGEYTEGLIGEPQFINPLYASLNDVDADIASLVYSGIMRWDTKLGIILDLADSITISEDQKTYTFHINEDSQFHNGDPVRARDVVFTVSTIQNAQYRSPLLSKLQNVSVEQVDDFTVSFTLNEPSSSFLSELTFGILPADIWSNVTPKNASIASFNLEPIGSGPYRFKEYTKDKQGTISSYILDRNPDFYRDGPMIEKLTFKFYNDANEAVQALQNKNIEGVSFVPPELTDAATSNRSIDLIRPSLNRSVALFFNQDKNKLLQKSEIRSAIAQTLDRSVIIEKALQGHGEPIDDPLLPLSTPLAFHTAHDVQSAKTILDNVDFPLAENSNFRVLSSKKITETKEEDFLRFTITTVDTTEFVQVAEQIKIALEEIGIQANIQKVGQEEFVTNILPARSYEMLVTGTLTDYNMDPYPFWHSSQNTETGLNLAGYKNKDADALLEKARTSTDIAVREESYRQFADLVAKDIPAVFLYQSTYTYALSSKIEQVDIAHIVYPHDRFANITDWYIKTKTTFW